MSVEDEIAQLNSAYFFREFTFSKNKFKPTTDLELELADAVVWLDDLRIIYQIKERNASTNTSPDQEEKWFKSAVLGKATKQVRNTLEYLQKYSLIEVANDRGHKFNLATTSASHIHKLVIYQPHEALPKACTAKRFHKSQTAGIIHVIKAADYLGILGTFVTPAEVSEYLAYREKLAEMWGSALEEVDEPVLVGHYLRNLPNEKPGTRFLKFLAELQQQDKDEWDISRIITLFPERRNTPEISPTDYYKIIKELAKVYRTDLRCFKQRFRLSMENSRKNESVKPYRFVASTGCGFIFIPLTKKEIPDRGKTLEAFTYLHKYDMHLDRCIGLTFAAEEGTGWYDVQWCLMEFPWKEDERTKGFIQENQPLRKVKAAVVERYGLDKMVD
jgi:hypothetical protein